MADTNTKFYEDVIRDTNKPLYGLATLYLESTHVSGATNIDEKFRVLYEELVRINAYPDVVQLLNKDGASTQNPDAVRIAQFLHDAPTILYLLARQNAHEGMLINALFFDPNVIAPPVTNTIKVSTPLFFYSSDLVKAKQNSGNADYAVLSNWFWAPFTIGENRFHSTEQSLMFGKAITFGDTAKSKEILATGAEYSAPGFNGPPTYRKFSKIMGEIKKKGREVSNFDEKVWVGVRYGIMLESLKAKFSQNEAAKSILLSTGDRAIAEASSRDYVWGIGTTSSKANSDPLKWKGSNLLGKALVETRAWLRNISYGSKINHEIVS